MVTDSGGLQEKASVLGLPCRTLRPNTERPVALTHGTNTLVAGDWPLFRLRAIPGWDVRVAQRILTRCAVL